MKHGPFICQKMVVLVLGLMITRKFVRNNKKIHGIISPNAKTTFFRKIAEFTIVL